MKIYIVDDDDKVRKVTQLLLAATGYPVEAYVSADEFLQQYQADMSGCLILDVQMPGTSGPELQLKLKQLGCEMPIIFITGYGDIKLAVQSMQEGAIDFITKPYQSDELIEKVKKALENEKHRLERAVSSASTQEILNSLTAREKEVLEQIIEGNASKVISIELGISERTVDVHRSNILKKFAVPNVVALMKKLMPILPLERTL